MKQHQLDPISLVFGGLLAALGAFLISADGHWESASGAWVLPTLLVVIGGAILWSTLRRLGDDTANNGDETVKEEEDGIEGYEVPDMSDL